MQGKEVAIAVCMAESEGSAVNQVATRRAIQGRPSAPSTVRTGSAQRTGVRATHREEARSATSIPLTKLLALLKDGVTLLQHEGFAQRMQGTRRSARQLGVIQLLFVVDSAKNMAPMGSALSATALQLPNLLKKEIAVGTAVTARRKCAR